MGWMADCRGSGDRGGEPPDGQDAASRGQLLEERARGLDLAAGWAPVRGRDAWMGRDDVPAECVELQFREDALHDRGACLARPASGQLTLGGERDAGDSGAAVARRLTHEEERRAGPDLEV